LSIPPSRCRRCSNMRRRSEIVSYSGEMTCSDWSLR
jgi:hypothetical protein